MIYNHPAQINKYIIASLHIIIISQRHLEEQMGNSSQKSLDSSFDSKQLKMQQYAFPRLFNYYQSDRINVPSEVKRINNITFQKLSEVQQRLLVQSSPLWFSYKLSKYFNASNQKFEKSQEGRQSNLMQKIQKLIKLVNLFEIQTLKIDYIQNRHIQVTNIHPIQLLQNQEKWVSVSSIFTKLINLRRNIQQNIQEVSQKQRILLLWNSKQKYQNKQIYQNYVLINKNLSSSINKDKFNARYLNFATNRCLKILQKIKELDSHILPRYYSLKVNGYKIQIQMERGLIFPMIINPNDFSPFEYVGYNKFLSSLPQYIQVKFIREIYECMSYLHANGIQHNDIRVKNIIYSVVDNRFKLIDFDISKMENPLQELQKNKINFQIYECLYQCYLQQQQIKQIYSSLLNQSNSYTNSQKMVLEQSYVQEKSKESQINKNNSDIILQHRKFYLQRSFLEPPQLKLLKLIIKDQQKMLTYQKKCFGVIDLKMMASMFLKLFHKMQGKQDQDKFKHYLQEFVKKSFYETELECFKNAFQKIIQFCLEDILLILKNNFKQKVLITITNSISIQNKQQVKELAIIKSPYLSIVQVICKFNSVQISGSGIIISKGVVLTAAHNLFSQIQSLKHLTQQKQPQIFIIAQVQNNFKQIKVSKYVMHDDYKVLSRQDRKKIDMCQLYFEDNEISSDKYILPIKWDHKDKQKSFQVIGFNPSGQLKIFEYSKPIKLLQNSIHYFNGRQDNPETGMSGGGIIIEQKKGVFKLIGLHQGKLANLNFGLLFASKNRSPKKFLKQISRKNKKQPKISLFQASLSSISDEDQQSETQNAQFKKLKRSIVKKRQKLIKSENEFKDKIKTKTKTNKKSIQMCLCPQQQNNSSDSQSSQNNDMTFLNKSKIQNQNFLNSQESYSDQVSSSYQQIFFRTSKLQHQGLQRFAEKEYEQAIEKFKQYLSAVKSQEKNRKQLHSKAYQHLGDCLMALKVYNEAIKLYRKSFRIQNVSKHGNNCEFKYKMAKKAKQTKLKAAIEQKIRYQRQLQQNKAQNIQNSQQNAVSFLQQKYKNFYKQLQKQFQQISTQIGRQQKKSNSQRQIKNNQSQAQQKQVPQQEKQKNQEEHRRKNEVSIDKLLLFNLQQQQ